MAKIRGWWPMLVLTVLVVAAYAQSANYPFVYDDLSGIVDDPVIGGADKVGEAARALLQPWRPLTRFSYAVTHAFFGFSKPAFHLTNVVIHLINTLLVFGIGVQVARRWISNTEPSHFGFMAASIHAVHPLYTEAVTYISGRSSSLCGLFYFGCLFFLMRAVEAGRVARRKLWFSAAGVFAVMAFAAKEEAITLPLIAAIFLALAGYRRAALVLAGAPVVIVLARLPAFMALYRTSAANQSLVELGTGAPVETLPYMLSAVKAAVFYYLTRLAMPFAQSVDPYVRTVESAFDPGFILAVLVLAILIAVAITLRTNQPAITFSLAALLVSPLLAYALIPLPDIAAEHRIYIAGLGFNLAAAWLLTRSRRLMWPLSIALAVVLMGGTIARNSVWSSNVRLWEQAEANSPNAIRPHLNLGAALQAAGDFDQALVEYRHALALNPRLPLVYSNMGSIYLEQGRLDNAETMLKRAVELSPSMPKPYINLAAIAVDRKKPDEAFDYAARAEKAGAARFWVHFLRAEAHALSGEFDASSTEYKVAAKLAEGNAVLQEEIQKRLDSVR